MIKNITIFFTLGLLLCVYSNKSNAESIAFTKTNFEQIKQQNIGKQWLMLLWSVDCPPCFKELSLIQEMRQTKPDLNIVIINVDDNEEVTNERERVLNSYGFAQLTNYYFADGEGDRSRYLIDPSWYGELPRSYFVEASGKFHGKSGLVSKSLLTKWLIQN